MKKPPWMHEKYAHIRIPKALLYNEKYCHHLSPEALVLYGLMMDRTSLSMKCRDKHFCLPDGTVTIIFTQREAMQLLHCKRDKIRKIMEQLEKTGLIKLKRCGRGRPYQITVIPQDWKRVTWKQPGMLKNLAEAAIIPAWDDGNPGLGNDGKIVPNNPDTSDFDRNNPILCELREQLGSFTEEQHVHNVLQMLELVAPFREMKLDAGTWFARTLDMRRFWDTLTPKHILETADVLGSATDYGDDPDMFALKVLLHVKSQSEPENLDILDH